MKSLAELAAIRDKMKDKVVIREGTQGIRVVVGMATCGIAAGARPVLNTFVEQVASANLSDKVTVTQTGCIGICQYEPVVEIVEDELLIKVGSTLHPMTKEHYIQWIVVSNDERYYEVKLFPEQDPVVRIPLLRNATVYAYCNLHGLWKTEIK